MVLFSGAINVTAGGVTSTTTVKFLVSDAPVFCAVELSVQFTCQV